MKLPDKEHGSESLQHLSKLEQTKELKSAITGNQLGKVTDRKRKALESARWLMHKRFGTNN